MKTTLKFTCAFFVLLSISVMLNQCKSPEDAKETSVQVKTDTVSAARPAAVDTSGAAPNVAATQVPLTLIIKNLASATAPVIVGVYGTKNKFPDPKDQLNEYKFVPADKELVAKITDLQFGTYALAIYQDVNSNGKIDKNLIGVPTEPYAFSNNFKPIVKAPAFKNCQFEYDSGTNTITMNMIR